MAGETIRRTVTAVVLLTLIAGCTNDALPYLTQTDEDGMVLTDTDCPTAETQISGGSPDGMPAKGQTELARVEEAVAGNDSARVVPRNGEVWSEAEDGTILVEKVEDFMILTTIADTSECPEAPVSSNGIPVIYDVG